MKKLYLPLITIIIFSLTACGRLGSSQKLVNRTIVINNGTVVDGRGSDPIQDGIVVIEGNLINFVGKAVDYTQLTSGQIIDARGGTILPGIIDSHVHSASDKAIRRKFLLGGVTAICDLGSPLVNMPLFDEDVLDGNPITRGFLAGPIITAPGGLPDAVLHENLNYEVGTPEDARAAVVNLYNRGADIIKVYLQEEINGTIYPMLTEDSLVAIVEEAHLLGRLVRAHVTYTSLLSMAIEAGVDIIEHVPFNPTQSETQSVSEAQLQSLLESKDPLQVYLTELFPHYEAQLKKMVEAGIIMVPTLDRPFGDLYRNPNPTPEQKMAIEIIVGIVRRFHELGGMVGLGTDWNIGISMVAGMPVGEMEMLLAAGLTPMEVIEASTRHSAYACGHGDKLGTLEPGMLADVIIVDGDPLTNIEALKRIVGIIVNGEVVYTQLQEAKQ